MTPEILKIEAQQAELERQRRQLIADEVTRRGVPLGGDIRITDESERYGATPAPANQILEVGFLYDSTREGRPHYSDRGGHHLRVYVHPAYRMEVSKDERGQYLTFYRK